MGPHRLACTAEELAPASLRCTGLPRRRCVGSERLVAIQELGHRVRPGVPRLRPRGSGCRASTRGAQACTALGPTRPRASGAQQRDCLAGPQPLRPVQRGQVARGAGRRAPSVAQRRLSERSVHGAQRTSHGGQRVAHIQVTHGVWGPLLQLRQRGQCARTNGSNSSSDSERTTLRRQIMASGCA